MRIFVSYRREDASAWAGRLRDTLTTQFGEGSIFQDVAAIRPGEDFSDAIDSALLRSDAALAVIGPRWLAATTPDGQPRLLDPDDYVRRELGAAVARGTLIIPVLVGGAAMPTPSQLPVELQSLGTRQAVALHDETWHEDVDRLIRALDDEPSPAPRRRALLAVGTAIVVLAVAGAGWLVLDGRSGKDAANGSSDETSDVTTDVPRTCPTPSGDGWTDLALTGATADDPTAGWRFRVEGGGYRSTAPHRWTVVLKSDATNQTNASQIHYPFYSLVVDSNEFQLQCFNVVAGDEQVSPGDTSEALVGFETTQEPTTGVALGVDSSGEHFRVDLHPSTTG